MRVQSARWAWPRTRRSQSQTKIGIAAIARFHILASNKDARESLARLLPPAAFERIAITYTGVNPDTNRRGPARSRRAGAYGLGDAFRLLTSTDVGADHLDLFRLLRATDVFCLPTFVDGLPIALLEAMALGVPVISTPVFAIPEAVIDDPARRARLAEHGRAHVIARFDERDSARIAWAGYARAAGW
jgi:glycosyltransferase involved in cell wall biosynthesis